MRIPTIGLLVIAAILFGCSNDDSDDSPFDRGNCIRATGAVITEERDLDNFHSINNTIPADIFIRQGILEAVVVEAPSDIMDELETNVANNTLTIEIDRCVEELENVRISVTIPEIRSLTLTGVGNMETVEDISTEELDVVLTGVGEFILMGEATTLNISLTGAGKVSAFDLMTNTSNISITGTGNVEVSASDELNATISGVGSIFYKGNPAITTNITGEGSVINAN